MTYWRQLRLVALMALLSAPSPAAAELATKVGSVHVRPGVTMQYLEIANTERPRAVVVLMAGGNGVLGLRPSGEVGIVRAAPVEPKPVGK